MPLYEYKCLGCGYVSEAIQRMSDPPLSTCDRCGGELKKLLSAPAFQFKGTGWYVTDYAGKEGKGGAGGGDSAPKGDARPDPGDSSKSSDSSKPEGKTKAERAMSG